MVIFRELSCRLVDVREIFSFLLKEGNFAESSGYDAGIIFVLLCYFWTLMYQITRLTVGSCWLER